MLEPSVGGPTRLACDIDLDTAGRTVASLGVIHSDGSEVEYGTVPVPVVTFVHGEGPTVLLTAGTHGDEWEGQILLHKLARELDPAQVRGRLIVMPALNAPAVLASSRVSPLDGHNLNRAYPGDRNGSPTSQIADFLTRYLLPHCDFAADLHSGGGCTEFVPCGFMTRMPHGTNTAAQAAAMEAFGMPYTVVYDEATEDRALDTACDQAGVVMVSSELSGGATVALGTLTAAASGLRRMLAHWGVLDGSDLPASPGTRFLDINGRDSSVIAMCHGLFEPRVGLADSVAAGDVVGWVHPVEDPDAPAIPLRAGMDGIVYQRRVPPMVQPGNIVLSVGTPVSRGDL
ncbi:MAG: hypothetical protein ACR2KE_02405 [Candidatus Nanopelagicales bacterium]